MDLWSKFRAGSSGSEGGTVEDVSNIRSGNMTDTNNGEGYWGGNSNTSAGAGAAGVLLSVPDAATDSPHPVTPLGERVSGGPFPAARQADLPSCPYRVAVVGWTIEW